MKAIWKTGSQKWLKNVKRLSTLDPLKMLNRLRASEKEF